MEIYKGIGTGHCEHEDLIDFLNYVFGMNGEAQGFYRLLPKLYRPQYRPEDYNFIVTEDGKLRAAVGAYPIEMEIMGERLAAVGVGNVAVHPFRRGKGYMKDAMHLAMADMVKKGADFAALGGRRQRYAYFGFEPAGLCGKFLLDGANLRHTFGTKENDTGYTVRLLGPEDAREIEGIDEIARRQGSHAIRPKDRLFDVMRTWESRVCAVLSPEGALAGYFLSTNHVCEIDCAAPAHAAGVLRACCAFMGKEELELIVPFYAREMLDLLSSVAEQCEVMETERYNVFHYQKVAGAVLRLKASYARLGDGEITMDIDGYAGREALRIAVKDGVPSVTAHEGACDVHYTHRQAMNALFGLFSWERRSLPPAVAAWFPLPLFVPEVDND
jgi:predicted N-acetyltransferase YhbS